jgi:hypothetical protein
MVFRRRGLNAVVRMLGRRIDAVLSDLAGSAAVKQSIQNNSFRPTKKGSGTVAGSARGVLRITVPSPFLLVLCCEMNVPRVGVEY